MRYEVTEPSNCPFKEEDYDGFPDGCKFDGTECYDGDNVPDDCPLRNGSITVELG